MDYMQAQHFAGVTWNFALPALPSPLGWCLSLALTRTGSAGLQARVKAVPKESECRRYDTSALCGAAPPGLQCLERSSLRGPEGPHYPKSSRCKVRHRPDDPHLSKISVIRAQTRRVDARSNTSTYAGFQRPSKKIQRSGD